ncbi:hypothetical protein Q3G72_012968 [Acer saccharum]|nr:hypothetical protein Q3G72_012968 [Acer saccharum]
MDSSPYRPILLGFRQVNEDLNPHAASTTTTYDMVVNGRPLKRMKRRVTVDLYYFLTFPAIEGSGAMEQKPRSGLFRFAKRDSRGRESVCVGFESFLVWFGDLEYVYCLCGR